MNMYLKGINLEKNDSNVSFTRKRTNKVLA